jgi:uncharacterized protein YukE
MSGALKSVFGGSGILGAMFSVASMFFPPAAIAASVSNLLTLSIGEAVKLAATTLVKEYAMPKFIEKIVNEVVERVVARMHRETDPQVDAYLGGSRDFQEFMGDLTNDMTRQIVENTRRHVAEAQDAKEKATGRRGPISASSWLEAIALAMGDIMGDKAAKMVELSMKMSDLNAAGQEIASQYDGLTPADPGLSDKKFAAANKKLEIEMKKIEAEQQTNAREFSKVQAQFQATSQEFNILTNTFNNAIKSIGEGLTTMARKG